MPQYKTEYLRNHLERYSSNITWNNIILKIITWKDIPGRTIVRQRLLLIQIYY